MAEAKKAARHYSANPRSHHRVHPGHISRSNDMDRDWEKQIVARRKSGVLVMRKVKVACAVTKTSIYSATKERTAQATAITHAT